MPTSTHTITVNRVTNGFIVSLIDENSNEVETLVAIASDTRGYSASCLISAIETLNDMAEVRESEADKKPAGTLGAAWGFTRSTDEPISARESEL